MQVSTGDFVNDALPGFQPLRVAAEKGKRLFHSDVVTVTDHRCQARCDIHIIEGQSGRHQILFTRSGAFIRHSIAGNRKTVADATQVHLLNAGETLRVTHPGNGGHDWTSFSFATDAIQKISGGRGELCESRPFAQTHATVSPEMLLTYQRIRAALRDGAVRKRPDSVSIEEAAITLLRQVLASSGCGNHGAGKRLHSLRQRNMVESAKVIMASAPGRPHRLSDLSREMNISPSHLAHVFRAVIGMSPHKYLLYLRLAIALEQLREGQTNLSRLALELGFSTHSHFTAAFRDCFGISPSEVRNPIALYQTRTSPENISTQSPPTAA